MLLNGTPVDPDKLKVLALNNFGHFTSMRVEDHRVRGLSLHLDRLVNDCGQVFGVQLDRDRLRAHIKQAVGDRGGAVVIRVTIFDPNLDLGNPGNQTDPQVLVTARSAVTSQLPPLKLKTTQYERDIPSVKHVGLFATMFHRRQAQLAGFDDVLFLDSRGYISEGATWNIGFLRGEDITWPDGQCLPGVTMELLKQLHQGTVDHVDPADLGSWDGAFITNAAIGVRPISAIDGHSWLDIPSFVKSLIEQYTAIEGERL
ncbi:MAG TPA: aminotransferase [Micromonosporaceae bacterium]|nr:aminotransferase [Micromonosporaceae bacterium]HCU52507.1 aminotransferase [Micromonosporaceae bacterium]